MVGLVVTPTTCLSSMSRRRSPLTRRPRDRSSSHIETPAAVSAASRSSATWIPLWARPGDHLPGAALDSLGTLTSPCRSGRACDRPPVCTTQRSVDLPGRDEALAEQSAPELDCLFQVTTSDR